MRVQSWAEFSAGREARRNRRPAGRHRHPKQERKTRTGNKMGVVAVLRHLRAVRGGALFGRAGPVPRPARGRQLGGDHGRRPRTGRKASACASRRSRRSRSWPASVQKALRIYVCATPAPLATLAAQLAVKGEGQVSFVLIKRGRAGRDRGRAARPLLASRRPSPRRCVRCRGSSRWSWSDRQHAAPRRWSICRALGSGSGAAFAERVAGLDRLLAELLAQRCRSRLRPARACATAVDEVGRVGLRAVGEVD